MQNNDSNTVLEKYFEYGTEALNEEEMLETFLALSLDIDNADKISKQLLSRFDTVDNIITSNADVIMQNSDINERGAVLLSLIDDIKHRIQTQKNDHMKDFSYCAVRKAFARNLLSNSKNEKIVIVMLDNKMQVASCEILSEGDADSAFAKPVEIVNVILKYDAPYTAVIHNHPNAKCEPSAYDYNFTANIIGALNDIGIRLVDHIVVGTDSEYSMAEECQINLFKEKYK